MAKKQTDLGITELVDPTPVEVVNIPTYPWRTQFNNASMPQDLEKNTHPSETIPDQSMSVKEILNRYAKGLPLHSNKQVGEYYGDDQYYPDLARLDLSEKQELYRENQAKIRSLQKLMEEDEQKEKQKKVEAAREEYRKKLREEVKEELRQESKKNM